MAKLKHLIYAALILYSIIMIGWHLTEPPSSLSLTKNNEKNVTVHELKTTYYNEKGHISNQFETPFAVHVDAEQTNKIQKPHIIATPNKSKVVSNQAEKVILDADNLVYNDDKHESHYQGNVKLSQGESHLKSDSAITLMDNHNKLVKAIAKALPNQRVHFWKKSDKKEPTIHAYADVITYLPSMGQIILNGNAFVKQGENSYKSEHIIYDINKKMVVSKKTKRNRTTITLDSKVL